MPITAKAACWASALHTVRDGSHYTTPSSLRTRFDLTRGGRLAHKKKKRRASLHAFL